MDDFALTPGKSNMYGLVQGDRNAVLPGKRPLSSMTPTIVLKNQEIKLLIGAAGGSTIITQVFFAITNVIDFNYNIAKAINLPRFHFQGQPNIVFMEPLAFSPELKKSLEQLGYSTKLGFIFKDRDTWGQSNGIEKDFLNNLWLGATDKRYDGLAEGY
jgi:gamma-glutamyltranspeptidase/glutathione hydrolase